MVAHSRGVPAKVVTHSARLVPVSNLSQMSARSTSAQSRCEMTVRGAIESMTLGNLMQFAKQFAKSNGGRIWLMGLIHPSSLNFVSRKAYGCF